MPGWLSYTLLAVAAWGLWGVVSKLAADAVPPLANQILATIGLLPLGMAGLARLRSHESKALKQGLLWGAVAGLAGAIGNLSFLAALSAGGPASVVTPLTAIYPLVTLSLAWLVLRERLLRAHFFGIALALAAVLLLNLERGGTNRSSLLTAWMSYALAALVMYGISAVFQKLSTNHIPAELCFSAFAGSFIIVGACILFTQTLQWQFSQKAWFYGLLGGALNAIGLWSTLRAFQRGGKASLVTPLAALYPVVTIFLSMLFLQERPTADKLIGVALAVAAGVVLSKE